MKKLILLVFYTFNALYCNAQDASPDVISTSGDFYKNSLISISWTLGDGIIETFKSDDIILTQGFQQSNLTVTAIKSLPDIRFKITAYPNPASAFIILKVEPEDFKKLHYSIYDVSGRMILKNRIMDPETIIPLAGYPPSSYYLKVYQDKREVKSFKIIKPLRK